MSIFVTPYEVNSPGGGWLDPIGSWITFRNVQIPKYAIISSAKLRIFSRSDSYGINSDANFSVQITAHGDLNSEQNHSEYIQSRTQSCVVWQIPDPWIGMFATPLEHLPDVTSIVQEIVALNQWSIGSKITFFIDYLMDGTNDRHPIKSGHGSGNIVTSPKLEVTWTVL